jgi:hypothetical protein
MRHDTGPNVPFSSIRTVTVGSGLAPDLLTPSSGDAGRSRARAPKCTYRRWGLPPRPENVCCQYKPQFGFAANAG